MIICVNNTLKFVIEDKSLIVKDKHLFNTKTNKNEGVDGDIVTFDSNDAQISGSVDGYTYQGRIKLRGDDKIYQGENVKFEHISVVENESQQNDAELKLAEI